MDLEHPWHLFDATRDLEVRGLGDGRWEVRRGDRPDVIAVLDSAGWDALRILGTIPPALDPGGGS